MASENCSFLLTNDEINQHPLILDKNETNATDYEALILLLFERRCGVNRDTEISLILSNY